jgi:hypothetical protein
MELGGWLGSGGVFFWWVVIGGDLRWSGSI